MNDLTTNPFEQLGSLKAFANRNGLELNAPETLSIYTNELQSKCGEVAKQLGKTIPELHDLRAINSSSLASD
jgi:hypothetical protein